MVDTEDINVGCFYRPPDAKVQLWSTLDGTLEALQARDIIQIGDLNVNTLDNSDSNFSYFEQFCLTLQLRNLVQDPTRITPTSSRCIDVILTNVDYLTEGIVEHVEFSDHAMVLATTKHVHVSHAVKPTGIERLQRNWRNLRAETLASALEFTMSHLSSSRLDNMWQEWRTKFWDALDMVVPAESKRKRHKSKHCPWMTPNLLTMIHKQKSRHHRIVRSNLQNKNLISEHRVLRNQTNNLYRQLKNRYFQQVLQNYKNSPCHFWNVINHVTGRKSQHFRVTAELRDLTDHFQSLLFQPGLSRELPNGPATKHLLCEFSPVSSREV